MNETEIITQTPSATPQGSARGGQSISAPDGPPGPFSIFGPDAETVFIDSSLRAWRLEDLPEPNRAAVVDAVALSRDPETLPNAALAAASRALGRHVRDLPPDRRVALLIAAARAIDQFESPVYQSGLEQYCEVRRLKDLLVRAEQTIAALTEFNCQSLAREMTGRVVLALTTKGARRRRPRATTKEMSR